MALFAKGAAEPLQYLFLVVNEQIEDRADELNDQAARNRQLYLLLALVAILVALFAAGGGLGELANAFDRTAVIDDRRATRRLAE